MSQNKPVLGASARTQPEVSGKLWNSFEFSKYRINYTLIHYMPDCDDDDMYFMEW